VLGLQEHDPESNPIAVKGFHSMFRVGSDGQLLTEAGVQFTQTPKTPLRPELGGLPLRAGATVIFSSDGAPRYVIKKPVPDDQRRSEIEDFVKEADARDPHNVWIDGEHFRHEDRMLRRFNLGAVHQAIRRRRPKSAEPAGGEPPK
jgi:hypothetical protein